MSTKSLLGVQAELRCSHLSAQTHSQIFLRPVTGKSWKCFNTFWLSQSCSSATWTTMLNLWKFLPRAFQWIIPFIPPKSKDFKPTPAREESQGSVHPWRNAIPSVQWWIGGGYTLPNKFVWLFGCQVLVTSHFSPALDDQDNANLIFFRSARTS